MCWVLNKELVDQVLKGGAVVAWDPCRLLLDNFENQTQQIIGFECVLKSAELVQNAAERPDVTFSGVRVALASLWAHIVRGTDHSLSRSVSVLQHPTNTKISKLDRVIASEENILRLQISMDHPTTMDVFKSQAHLYKPIEYLVLCEPLPFALPPLDMVGQVPYFAVLHDDD